MGGTTELASLPTQMPESAKAAASETRRWFGAAFALALFSFAAFVLGRIVAELNFAELAAAIRETTRGQIALALAAACVSYLALVGYDWLALDRLGRRVPLGLVALASFAGNAFSFVLGLPLVTGSASRYWVYAKVGLNARQVFGIVLFATVTFWLGMTAEMGFGLIFASAPLASIDHLPAATNFLIGLLLVGALALYVAWVWNGHRRLRLWGGSIELPGPRAMLTQIALGVGDIGGAAATLYVLLPEQSQAVGVPAFGALYVAAAVVGGASHAPGGVGVFEAFMLGLLPAPSREALLAALLVFRIIYYVIPFLLAASLMALRDGNAPFVELFRLMRKSQREGGAG